MNILRFVKSLGHPRHWLQDDLLRRLFKNAAVLFSGNVGASLLGLASLAMTARALGVENFGILVLITTYVGIVDKLVNFQTWQAIIKYGADALEKESDEDFKSLLKFGFLMDCSTAVLGMIIAASAAWFVGHWRGWDQQLVIMATIYSSTILFHIQGTPMAILRLFDKFNKLAYQHVIASAIKLAGVTIAFFVGAGLWSFLIVWAMVDILGKLLLVCMAYNELLLQKHHDFMHATTRNIGRKFSRIWGFVLTTNINSSIRMASREVDIMIIAALLSPAAVGLYKIAKQFSLVLQKTIDPLYQSIFPDLARLYAKGEVKEFVRFGLRSSLLAGLFALSVWFFFIFFGEIVILLIFGEEYLKAVEVMLWYMMAIVVAAAAFPLQPAMLSMGRPHTTLGVHLAATLIYFTALFFLLPSTGLLGAGISYLIYYISWSAFMLAIEIFLISRRLTPSAAETN
ncbi:lipopolysaccharide biosynthesis protein [Desulfonatronum lacustre]|uniref:lipopolysaccharide biosynthesis protein n=1 Tax=Desulfonatronum lacustre TaxID=66849 RepID=UPI00048A821C|nr:oligosaccharide flippase family protein [Desulfonatronum lacustre]